MWGFIGVLNNQEIEVTIASLVPARPTTEENYSVRVNCPDQPVDDHAKQVLVYDYLFQSPIFLIRSWAWTEGQEGLDPDVPRITSTTVRLKLPRRYTLR